MSTMANWVFLALFLVFLALVGAAAYLGEVSWIRAGSMLLLGGVTLFALAGFVQYLEEEGPPQLASWSGLGGRGGWRVSRSLLLAIVALAFGTLFALEARRTEPNRAEPAAEETKPAEAELAAPEAELVAPATEPAAPEAELVIPATEPATPAADFEDPPSIPEPNTPPPMPE